MKKRFPSSSKRNDDVVKLPENSMIGKVGVKSEDGGKLYYAHVTEARPDAEVLAKTGSLPLLMTHPAGKGRCSVFAGTVLGAAKDAPDAFWIGKEWGGIFAEALRK